ncbi:MAG: tetratricopeptide repeat protein, partial [Planctomycetes bacterium]|nr:tetratricopeptide repeat protein [Planctomycetota bacterium]
QYVAALDSFHKALHIKPDYAETWNNLGNALKSLGKMENAIESYRKAISHKPDYAAAYFALAQTKQHTEYDGDMTAMETLLGKSGITDKEKVQICFGLGKAFEDLKQYDEAFNYFQNGNRIKRNMFDYSISAERVFFDKLVKVFDKKFFDQRKGCGCNRDVPIFVLGMPRSGTTLVEQILASHYQVFGAGELSDIKQLLFEQNHELRHETFPENVSGFDLKVFTQLGEEYIRRISRYNIDRKDYVTDKMPFNTLFIGMIKVILPMAKVIHCRRNPVDTCLSCYKADFNEYKKFSYDLTEIGQYYRLYHNLMTHWHEVLPDFIYDVQYEDLVADQELQTRQLLDFCGLPWHEACLSFHTLDRKIKTASFSQARQPLYKSSVHSWKRYEKHLGPLLEALGPGEKGKK